jgi:hypothetical protein
MTKMNKEKCSINPIIPDEKLLRRYGLTPDNYYEILLTQNYRCAICERIRELVVDHCHKSKKPRALLCSKCNFGLGFFEDDLHSLIRAAKYIKCHSE